MKPSIRLTPIYLLSLISLLMFTPMALAAQEHAGKVIVSTGEVWVIPKEGERREIKRGSMIYAKDVIYTGEDSRVKIRFTDNTLVAIRPNSEFRVDLYRYKDIEPKDYRQVSTIIKGGFRTITGAISKKNPNAYQARTPLGTIGIRATSFEIFLKYANEQEITNLDELAVFLAVTEGKACLCNTRHCYGPSSEFPFAKITSDDVVGMTELPEGTLDADSLIDANPPSNGGQTQQSASSEDT